MNTENLIQAVKSSKSPKMALDGVKLLLGDSKDYKLIFHHVFELAWKDAAKRNRSIERHLGRNRDKKWKPRIVPDDTGFNEDLASFSQTRSAKKRSKILGRILSEYESVSIFKFFAKITGKEAA
jgi:hypothetical protein